MYKFDQGEDILIKIPLLDDVNQPVSMSGATSVRVSLSIKNEVVQKYMDTSLETAISGYGTCNSGATLTDLNINVLRSESADFPIGDISASVLIKYLDGFKDNMYYEYKFDDIAICYKGNLKKETFV